VLPESEAVPIASTPQVSRQQSALARDIERQSAAFRAVYKPEGQFEGMQPTELWLHSYYRMPRPDLLQGALREMMLAPITWHGYKSLLPVVFLSNLLKELLQTTNDIDAFMYSLSALAASAGNSPSSKAVSDIVLRAMYMAQEPRFDSFLALRVQQNCEQLVAANSTTQRDLLDQLLAMEISLCPPRHVRHRDGILNWPIPPMNIAAFQKHVASFEFPMYGATRFLFEATHAGYYHATRKPASFAAYIPQLATVVTKSMASSALPIVSAHRCTQVYITCCAGVRLCGRISFSGHAAGYHAHAGRGHAV
jgi:hypothetical protein